VTRIRPLVNVAAVRQALDFGGRPDPARGIFETMLVSDGQVPLLDAQLTRLGTSANELYSETLTPGLKAAVEAATPPGTARLRVTLIPGERIQIDHGPRAPDPVYREIAPFALPGGLGPHKWADRSLLDAITAAAGDHALPLLIDTDHSVLESTRMNVLIEEHGRLISPPADRRFRSGFGRTSLRYDEEPVDLDRLLAADAVVLTSALRVVRLELAASDH
jgi:para-aminobenzoate synthetase/4-amino-4-deoxychorismate lyase